MAIIDLRDPFKPRADAEPAPGQRDPILEDLATADAIVAAMPDTPVIRPARMPANADAAISVLESGRRLHWQVKDGQDRLVTSPMGVASRDSAYADAKAQTPTSGYGGPSDLIVVLDAAKARVVRNLEQQALKVMIAKLNPKIGKFNVAAPAALKDFVESIDEAEFLYETPQTLGDGETADNRVDRWIVEIDSQGSDGMRWALGQMMAMVRFERDELLPSLMAASKSVAARWMRESPSAHARDRQASHYSESIYVQTSSTEGADPHTQATHVLQWISKYREAMRPPAIDMARQVLKILSKVFTSICGVRPNMVNYYQVDGDLSQQGPAWAIDEGWPSRYCPPHGDELPGWSRIRMKSEGGVPVREAGAGEIPEPPMARAEVKNLSASTFEQQRQQKRAALIVELHGGRG